MVIEIQPLNTKLKTMFDIELKKRGHELNLKKNLLKESP